jgi:hypothetical protein
VNNVTPDALFSLLGTDLVVSSKQQRKLHKIRFRTGLDGDFNDRVRHELKFTDPKRLSTSVCGESSSGVRPGDVLNSVVMKGKDSNSILVMKLCPSSPYTISTHGLYFLVFENNRL